MEVPTSQVTGFLYERLNELEKRVVTIEKQLLESCIGSLVKEASEKAKATSRQTPVATVGMSCRYQHVNEFGVFAEACLRDASALIDSRAYCTAHAAKIRATEAMVKEEGR